MHTNSIIRHSITTILICLVFVSTVIAVPIPSKLKTILAFIFITNEEGKLIPNGTGFFVGVKIPTNSNSMIVYMVTAKHILYKPKTTEFLDKVFVRLNKKGGGSQIVSLTLLADGEKRNVFCHTDSSVDIAVIPFLPDQEKIDFSPLPSDMITTKEAYKELSIREGTDVFFAGLFTPYLGSKRNYPVFRFGHVALVTEERIKWKGNLMDLYLIEAGSYGGNSGSPVFFYLGSDRDLLSGNLIAGAPILKLAGVMQGTFLDFHEIKVVETKKVPFAISNMGIAAVVPGYKIHEVLFGKELKEKRGF